MMDTAVKAFIQQLNSQLNKVQQLLFSSSENQLHLSYY